MFDQNLIVMKEMERETPIKEVKFETELFWVQIHNHPIVGMTRALGEKIGATIGRVVEVESNTEGLCWGRYLRVWISLDLSKPLPRGQLIHFPFRDVFVKFQYERLLKFCFHCGCIVHPKEMCLSPKTSHMHSQTPSAQYGSWLWAESFTCKSGQKSQRFSSEEKEKLEYQSCDSAEASSVLKEGKPTEVGKSMFQGEKQQRNSNGESRHTGIEEVARIGGVQGTEINLQIVNVNNEDSEKISKCLGDKLLEASGMGGIATTKLGVFVVDESKEEKHGKEDGKERKEKWRNKWNRRARGSPDDDMELGGKFLASIGEKRCFDAEDLAESKEDPVEVESLSKRSKKETEAKVQPLQGP